MLIKFKSDILNLDNLISFFENGKTTISFQGVDSDYRIILKFDSEEEKLKAIDKILDAYRWQRLVCDLG